MDREAWDNGLSSRRKIDEGMKRANIPEDMGGSTLRNDVAKTPP
jgi:hypothetical protein